MTIDKFIESLNLANAQSEGFASQQLGTAPADDEVARWEQSGLPAPPDDHRSLLLRHNGVRLDCSPGTPGAARLFSLAEIQAAADDYGFMLENGPVSAEQCLFVGADADSSWFLLFDAKKKKYYRLGANEERPEKTFKDFGALLDWLVKQYVPRVSRIAQPAAAAGLDVAELLREASWSAAGSRESVADLSLADDSLWCATASMIARLSVPRLEPLPTPGVPAGSLLRVHALKAEPAVVVAYMAAKNRVARLPLSAAEPFFFEDTPGALFDTEVSPGDRYLAVSCFDKNLYFFDLASGRIVGTAAGMACGPRSMTFIAPDALLVWTAVGPLVWLSVPDGRVLRTLDWSAPAGGAFVADRSADRVVIADGKSKNAKVVRLATGKVLNQLKGHAKFVNCCAFSPDDRSIATGGGDGMIGLWSAESGALLARSLAHKAGGDPRHSIVERITFSAAGDHLFTCGRNGDVNAFATLTS